MVVRVVVLRLGVQAVLRGGSLLRARHGILVQGRLVAQGAALMLQQHLLVLGQLVLGAAV